MPEQIKSFAWRLVHRPIPIILAGFYMWIMEGVGDWYMGLPDPSPEQSAFAGVVVAGAIAYFKLYVDSDAQK